MEVSCVETGVAEIRVWCTTDTQDIVGKGNRKHTILQFDRPSVVSIPTYVQNKPADISTPRPLPVLPAPHCSTLSLALAAPQRHAPIGIPLVMAHSSASSTWRQARTPTTLQTAHAAIHTSFAPVFTPASTATRGQPAVSAPSHARAPTELQTLASRHTSASYGQDLSPVSNAFP
jgi:hypothetical protein